MRILQVVHKFLPNSLGGTEIYTLMLSKELAVEHEVSIFCGDVPQNSGSFTHWDDVYEELPVHRIAERLSGWRSNPVHTFLSTFSSRKVETAFTELINRLQPDVVHVQHLMGLSAGLARITRQSGVPVIMTLHDYWMICPNAQLVLPSTNICTKGANGFRCIGCLHGRFDRSFLLLGSPLIALLFKFRQLIVSGIRDQVDLFVCPSEFLRNKYLAHGLPGEKLIFLENGIKTDEIRKWTRQTSSKIRFAYIGSIAWQKGVHLLCKAFDASLPPHCELKIYGDTAVFPEYADATRSLVQNPNVKFMGRLEHSEIGRVLAETDLLVVPSVWYENSPMVIQEAFAASVPVLSADIGALREKVRDGVDGILFRTGDVDSLKEKMAFVALHPEELRKLTLGIRPPQTIEQSAKVLGQLYEQLSSKKWGK